MRASNILFLFCGFAIASMMVSPLFGGLIAVWTGVAGFLVRRYEDEPSWV